MKDIKIELPEDVVIDKDKSVVGNIVLKKKSTKQKYFIDKTGTVGLWNNGDDDKYYPRAFKNIFRLEQIGDYLRLIKTRDEWTNDWRPDLGVDDVYCLVSEIKQYSRLERFKAWPKKLQTRRQIVVKKLDISQNAPTFSGSLVFSFPTYEQAQYFLDDNFFELYRVIDLF